MISTLGLFALSLVGVLVSAHYLISGALSLAYRLKVPPLLIGFTFVAFGTSAPELFVSLQAASVGQSDMIYGNVIGSNVANILFLIGTVGLVSLIAINKTASLKRDALFMLTVTVLFTVAFYTLPALTWPLGLGMIGLLAGYIFYSYTHSRQDLLTQMEEEATDPHYALWLAIVLFVAALAGLLLSSDLLINTSETLARLWGVPETVIGLTLIALGTSLPEVAAGMAAALKKHQDVATGTILGSNTFNILLIMGVSSFVAPLPMPEEAQGVNAVFFLGSAALFCGLLFFCKSISRLVAFACLLLYLGFLAYQAGLLG